MRSPTWTRPHRNSPSPSEPELLPYSSAPAIGLIRPFVLCQYLALPPFDRSLFAPLEQPRRLHPLRPCRERRRGTAPAKRLDLLKERRIGAQGREILEEQREIAPFAENDWREVLSA